MSEGRTVILADGDPGLLQAFEKVLALAGFSVSVCSTGLDVIRKAVSKPPSLIICGYYLPQLDGIRVCRYVKGEPGLSGVPFVLLIPGPDSHLRRKADWAGADSIRELPVRSEDLIAIAGSLADEPLAATHGRPLEDAFDRGSVLEKVCGQLESRLNRLEAVRELTEELGRTASVREIFRRLATGILAGLNFDRVWLARYLEQTDELITESARGRNMGDIPASVFVREHANLPMGVAVRELVQVASREMDIPEERLVWAGSTDYVDTPLVAGGRPVGLIRCDRSATGRRIAPDELEALRYYAAHAAEVILNAMILEDLSDEREQMSAIMNSLDAGILLVDSSGTILRATPMASVLFSRSLDELKGGRAGEVLPELSTGTGDAFTKALREEREILDNVLSIGQAGAGERILKVSFLPLRKSGHFTGMMVTATDVTENHELRENLRRTNEQLETISVIGSELNSTQDLDRICSEVLKALRRFFPCEAITVFLAEGGRESMIPDSVKAAATAGYDRDSDPLGLIIRISDTPALANSGSGADYSQGIVSGSIAALKPVSVPYVRDSVKYIENLPGTRSELSVPMIVQGRVVGAIDIQSPSPAKFTAESERTVVALANHAATAVENAMLHSRILSMARRDRLTGLGNLRYFEEKLEEEFRRTDRSNFPFSLIMMDIDDFKHYNDSWGHLMGNTLLNTVVKAMSGAIREVDVLIRYGGEEFVCILPFTGEQESAEIAERIRRKVVESSASIPHSEQQPLGMVSISLGVSTYLTDVGDREMLLKYADQRMYMAKRTGKNRVVAPALGNCQFAG